MYKLHTKAYGAFLFFDGAGLVFKTGFLFGTGIADVMQGFFSQVDADFDWTRWLLLGYQRLIQFDDVIERARADFPFPHEQVLESLLGKGLASKDLTKRRYVYSFLKWKLTKVHNKRSYSKIMYVYSVSGWTKVLNIFIWT